MNLNEILHEIRWIFLRLKTSSDLKDTGLVV